jgi:hypothetical protein
MESRKVGEKKIKKQIGFCQKISKSQHLYPWRLKLSENYIPIFKKICNVRLD